MNDFEKNTLKLEGLDENELQGLLKYAYIYARYISRNGIDLYTSEDFEGKLKKDSFLHLNDVISSLINQTINRLADKRPDINRTPMNCDEIKNLNFFELYMYNNNSSSRILLDFKQLFYQYIINIPDAEYIVDIISDFDEYIRNNGDSYTLEVYNRLTYDEIIYLIGKLLLLSKDDLNEMYEQEMHIKQAREKIYQRKRAKVKQKYPKLRERKKECFSNKK